MAALASLRPDVAVLQEVTLSNWAGLPHLASGIDLLAPGVQQTLPRFVAVASRFPLRPVESAPVPSPEVVACVEVASPRGAIEILGVHIPTIAKGRQLKLETEEGLAARLRQPCDLPRIVI